MKRRTIKTKTYYNFMLIMKAIQAKGYSFEEAERMAHHLFDSMNPYGLSIWHYVDMIVPANEKA